MSAEKPLSESAAFTSSPCSLAISCLPASSEETIECAFSATMPRIMFLTLSELTARVTALTSASTTSLKGGAGPDMREKCSTGLYCALTQPRHQNKRKMPQLLALLFCAVLIVAAARHVELLSYPRCERTGRRRLVANAPGDRILCWRRRKCPRRDEMRQAGDMHRSEAGASPFIAQASLTASPVNRGLLRAYAAFKRCIIVLLSTPTC